MGERVRDKAQAFIFYWKIYAPLGAALPIAEYPFSKAVGRKHRFDWAFLQSKVAVEVDGGVHAPGGGRHAGDKDREKLNLAHELGWHVLRYSPAMLDNDPEACIKQVLRVMELM